MFWDPLWPSGALWPSGTIRPISHVVLPHKAMLDQVNNIELTLVLPTVGYTGTYEALILYNFYVKLMCFVVYIVVSQYNGPEYE